MAHSADPPATPPLRPPLRPALRIAILGSVGVPARYGGFETLADNLVRYHAVMDRPEALAVYCSRPAYPDRPERHGQAELRYSRLRANGGSSILYDAVTLRDALTRGVDVALLLGVSGAMALPILPRRGAKIIVHVDGLEWRRGKWSGPARRFLRLCEGLSVRHADAVIADSPTIADHIAADYGVTAEAIAYGGDHAVTPPDPPSPPPEGLPPGYALVLCRIEPENNIEMILDAVAAARYPLVAVGNWEDSAYGRALRARFGGHDHMALLDPIYAPGPLYALRQAASAYIHGHSAGGTNPALVEMMHVGHPIFAHDCTFNRQTTHGEAVFFDSAPALTEALGKPVPPAHIARMRSIAREHYTWDRIGAAYFDLFARIAGRV